MGIRRNSVVVKMLPSTSILSCAETKSNGYVDPDLKVRYTRRGWPRIITQKISAFLLNTEH